MIHKEITLDSRIEEKIQWAKDCFQIQKSLFLNDAAINQLLTTFKKAAYNSHSEMHQVGIHRECEACEVMDDGSCCGTGLEDKYSVELLLINLLLGQELPKHRHDPSGCFFLKDKGCALLARHVICINYLCHKITNKFNVEQLAPLREKEGVEIELLFLLNERIKEQLKHV